MPWSDFTARDKDARERRGGDEVGDLAVVGELVNKKIGLLAAFERANAVAQAEAPCGIDGGRGERLGRGEPMCRQASETMNGMEEIGDEPGLKSLASTMARPCSTMARAGG